VCVYRFTSQPQVFYPETQEDLHPDCRASPKLVFSQGLLGGVGRDADDVDFLEPLLEEDLDSHLDSVPDQDSRLNEVVATPTNGAPWTTGGEITPVFSSIFRVHLTPML